MPDINTPSSVHTPSAMGNLSIRGGGEKRKKKLKKLAILINMRYISVVRAISKYKGDK